MILDHLRRLTAKALSKIAVEGRDVGGEVVG